MKAVAWRVKNLSQKFFDFFFRPASARPLAALRIGLGLCLLLQAFMLRATVFDFLSSTGYIQGGLARILNDSTLPQISWLQSVLGPLGIDEKASILVVCWVYVASLVALTAGYRTRFAALLAWFFHWLLINSANSASYGVDQYAHIFLFYLIFAPSGDAWSLDAVEERASAGARLTLRVMQLHLCISYLGSGIEKAQGPQWWNGELLWRALNLPVYKQFDMTWLASWPWLSAVAGWMTLTLELGYCIFIWPKKTRKIWVLGIIGMHLGISFLLGLHLFGFVMAVLTASLFGVSAEPQPEWISEKDWPHRVSSFG